MKNKRNELTSFWSSKMRSHRNLDIFLMLSVVFSCFLLVSSSGDAEILIRVKKTRLGDPHGKLGNWVITGGDGRSPCNWTGIACDPQNGTVLGIDLSGFGLFGEFPYGFCRIRTLRNLTLGENYLNGTISSPSLSLCSHLKVLILSENYFVGKLPEFSPEFVSLRVLELKSNNFVGEIPASYGWFPVLEVLNLGGNMLDGRIPEFIGNLSELSRLELGYNPFTPGPIPSNIGNLTKLNYLWLSNAYLIGEIPQSIGNLVALTNLDLTTNSLTGKIPGSIGGLRSIERIFLYENSLSGELPEIIGNLSTLIEFDVSENNFSGKIPAKIAALKLSSFNLNDNFFTGEIPEIVASNPNLYEFKIFNNSFSGKLPLDLGRFSDLEDFDCSSNNLTGELPPFLCSRNRLQRIVAFGNSLSGRIPEAYGLCDTLNYVRIENNLLSGEVPIRFWGLPQLDMLKMSDNRLEGSVSPMISRARNLSQLHISGNSFSGDIPVELCDLHNLILLDLSRNRLPGSIRPCITDLKKLQKLDMQENLLTGPIPGLVSSWTGLTELNLSHNQLSGQIPSDLGELPVLTYLDLSNNFISGLIPANLGKLKLNQFNISNNRLYGRVPFEFQNALFKSSLIGNPGLCAPDFYPIPPCRSKHETLILVAVVIIFVAVLIASLVWFFLKTKPLSSFTKSNRRYKVTVFQRIGFTEKDIFSQLTEENVIGSGGSGQVYKVILKSGQVFAVKKLWGDGGATTKRDLEAAFFSEVETLGRVRHRNIVKLVMCCRGEDHRILVYEFMEKGSLGDVLHWEKGRPAVSNLDWTARHAIAVGAAKGLEYLHHDCVPAIVHRDVKSNNILLDAEMEPRVADFGLAKSLEKDGNGIDAAAMSRVAGSYGYIAPEYAYTLQVNEKTDVYSFGVVLLELITGKRPNDPSFGENKDIIRFVMEAVLSSSPRDINYDSAHHRFSGLKELVDPRMKPSASDFEGIEKVLDVALLCTSSFPMNRPSMRKVVELL